MIKKIAFFSGLVVLIAAIASSVPMVIPTPGYEEIPLPVSRILACPVGSAQLGKTTVMVTDQEIFTAGPFNATPAQTTSSTFENPATAIMIRGSASVGGVSQYTEGSGTMMAPCSPPTTTATWNAVMTNQAASTLILNNVDTSQAVVDVFLYGPTGQIPIPGLSDITVTPGAMQMLSIDQMIDAETPITVHMRASKGRVLAMMRITGSLGLDWQTPQINPGTDLIVAGIPAGDSPRTLSITNTDSTTKAMVDVEIISESGTYPPIGFETIEVSPSTVVNLDITQTLSGQAAAVHLQSDHPVTSAVAVMESDIAVISAQPTLNGEVVLPPLGGTLWLVNPQSNSTTVSIRTEGDQTVLGAKDVQVPPQAIMQVVYPAEATWVRISTKSPAIAAAVVLSDTSLSVIPVTGGGSATSVIVPQRDPGLG